MRIRYTSAAIQELDALLNYVQDHSPRGARRVHARIKKIEELIRAFPESGRGIRFGLRQISVTPYGYLIFYDVTGDEIVIHRVRHSTRKPVQR